MRRHTVWLLLRLLVKVKGYSWQFITPSGSPPSPRQSHVAAWSDDANGLYIFGGEEGSALNDFYFFSRQGTSWQLISLSGSAPSARSLHAAAWSTAADGLYIFGGSDGSALDDLWLFDRQSNAWQPITVSGAVPTARFGHSAVWSQQADGLYIFGGHDGVGALDDLWLFDRQGNAWQQISPSGSAPAARQNHAAAWSDAADGMYVFGGFEDGGNELSELYLFHRQGNSWQQLSPSGSIPARGFHSAVWADSADGLYVFGGFAGSNLDDLWFYGSQANAWQQLSPGGSAPSAQRAHAAAWSDVADGMYIFGGYDGSSLLDDLVFLQTTTTTTSTQTATTTATTTQSTQTGTATTTATLSTLTQTTTTTTSTQTATTTATTTQTTQTGTATTTATLSTLTQSTTTTWTSSTSATSTSSTTSTATSSGSSTRTGTTSTGSNTTTTTATRSTTSSVMSSSSTLTSSSSAIGSRTSTSSTTDRTTSDFSSTSSATSQSAEEVYSPTDLESLESQRREAAAQAVAAVEDAVTAAVGQAILELEGGEQNQSGITEVSIESDVGPVKVAALAADALANSTAEVSLGDAVVFISSTVLEELTSQASSSTVLFTMASVNSTALRTDHIMVAEEPQVALQVRSEPISLNFWAPDGSKIKVEDLTQPVTMLLKVNANATCALWEDGKWSRSALSTLPAESGFIKCSTAHFSIFAGVVEVLTRNIAVALRCSTFSSLVTEASFRALQRTAWLESPASILSISFLALSLIFTCAALWIDRRALQILPMDEREQLLFSVKAKKQQNLQEKKPEESVEKEKEADKEEERGEKEKEGDDLDLQKPPSEVFRSAASGMLDLLSQAVGGDSMADGMKELLDNAEAASIDKSICMLQAHRSGADQATIKLLERVDAVTQDAPAETLGRPQRGSWRASVERLSDRVRGSKRPDVTHKVSAIKARAKQSGAGAASDFLQSWWPRRVMVLFPAGHAWLKVLRFSLTAPHSVRVALISMKIIGAGALSALFFSSSAPTPDSDPECEPSVDPFESLVQTVTVGFVTAVLGDGIILVFYLFQRKAVVHREVWTENMKSWKRMWWRVRTQLFWIISFIYTSVCQLYTFLFLANVRALDAAEWLESVAVSLVQDVLLKPFLSALILATIASLMLCCRPAVRRKMEAKWIESQADMQEPNEEKVEEPGDIQDTGQEDHAAAGDEDGSSWNPDELLEAEQCDELLEL